MDNKIVHKKASYALLILFVLYFLYTIFYISYGKQKEPKANDIITKITQTPIAQKSFGIYTSCIRQNWGLFTPLVHYNAEVYLYIHDTISNRIVDSIGMISYFAKRKTSAWFLSSTYEAYDHLFYNCVYSFLKQHYVYKESGNLLKFESDSIASIQLKNIKAFIPIIVKQKNIFTVHINFKLQFVYLPISGMPPKQESTKPNILYTTTFFNLQHAK